MLIQKLYFRKNIIIKRRFTLYFSSFKLNDICYTCTQKKIYICTPVVALFLIQLSLNKRIVKIQSLALLMQLIDGMVLWYIHVSRLDSKLPSTPLFRSTH